MGNQLPFATAFPISEIARDDAGVPGGLTSAWPREVPALYVQGAWPIEERAIAVVGTTAPTPGARQWVYQFAGEAARRGWTVVSGLAYGTDVAAHLGALAVGGRTVAVIADGHDRIFPADHRALARRMVREGGTIVSISPAGVRGGRPGLLMRNRFTSALSAVVVTGQARAWDGAMATLRHAYRQGKVIAALVPLEASNYADWRGNDLLLGKRSPWREHLDDWAPAIPIWPDEGTAAFFEALEHAPDLLDGRSYRPETPRETQARLLESIAPYRV